MKRTQRLFLLALPAAWLLLAIVGCGIHAESVTIPPTPDFSGEADALFISSIARGVELNSGITMEQAWPASSERIDINSVTFAVFNHTDEPITFPNQGFGVAVFGYDRATRQWQKQHLQHFPNPTPKTLPPKIEKWDWDIQNIWDVLNNDLDALPYKELRFYIVGTGNVTQKKYGAYLDVTILP